MAIYNLNGGSLESLLHTSFSPGTESAIIDAIKNAGIVDLTSGKIGVEVEKKGGSYSIPNQVQVFLDTGSHNTITIKDHGAKLIGAGDGTNHVIDNGPGGDTLVGGAGQELLKVAHGENLLIAGSGENTLIGGAGHDTLIGGGSSKLEAGKGGSTLTGGSGNDSSDTLIGVDIRMKSALIPSADLWGRCYRGGHRIPTGVMLLVASHWIAVTFRLDRSLLCTASIGTSPDCRICPT